MFTAIFLATLTAVVVSQSVYEPCPVIYPPNQAFAMPGPMSKATAANWIPAIAVVNEPSAAGLEFSDVNGDSLVDLVWALYDYLAKPSDYVQCVYLNTGCGWGE